MEVMDFVGKHGVCCRNCEHEKYCPEDYECETIERTRYHFWCLEHGAKVKIIDIRNGNSTEKVRE